MLGKRCPYKLKVRTFVSPPRCNAVVMRPSSPFFLEIVMNELRKNQNFHSDLQIHPTLLNSTYREFSPNANFITANFVTAVFQNFPDI